MNRDDLPDRLGKSIKQAMSSLSHRNESPHDSRGILGRWLQRYMQISPHVRHLVIPIHLLCGWAFIRLLMGWTSFSWLWASLLGWVLISGFGIAVGFHRLFSHRSFVVAPWLEKTLAYLGCLGCQGSPLFWVSLHNGLHHPYADTAKDLHSPVLGRWNSYMGWQFHLNPKSIPMRMASALHSKKYFRFLHKNYYSLVWGTLAVAAVISHDLALFLLVVPMTLSLHSENLVDLFGHWPIFGYRNHSTRDLSSNNFILGFLTFGQGWHNNHHWRPNDYNFGGDRWWEWDPSVVLIGILKVLSRISEKTPNKAEKKQSLETALTVD